MSIKTLKRIIQEVQAAQDVSQALHAVVASVRAELQADACSLFLINETRGEFVLQASEGLKDAQIGKARFKLGEGLVGYVIEREEPINLATAQTHPNYLALDTFDYKDLHGFIGVPLTHKAAPLGVIVLQRHAAVEFPKEEEALLLTLAMQLAGVINRLRSKGVLVELNGRRRKKRADTVLYGLPGCAGVALGKAVVVYPPADLDAVPDRAAVDVDAEIKIFEDALAQAREEMYDLQARAKSAFSVAENALFDAYLRILDSRSLMNEVEEEIEKGQWAQGALRRVIKKHVLQFESLEDVYLQERAADFRDLGRRILAQMQKSKRQAPEYPKNTILVSDEVTPTALMEVPEGCLQGVISGSGSGNSHVAILARALGLPTVMGVTGAPINQLAGKELVVDGYNGQVYLSPSATLKKEFKSLAAEETQLDAELEKLRDEPALTTDGHILSLYINTGLAIEGSRSLSVGAEGIGLYRTEMPFMLRERFPSEEEQRIMYRQLLSTFTPRPVVMRTLDIGGDKNLPYFPVQEENPFLGWRGIRITLDHPEIFLQQLRAMLKASEGFENLSVLLPMVSSISEVESATRLLTQAHQEMLEEGLNIVKPKIGTMIEVPAAVYQAYELAKRVDFLSVGSNDLIQYILAVDRNNPRVANLYNGLHPAVLRALADVVKAGHKAHKKVSICGELASDPVAVVLLLGMGYDALSMNARSLPRMKWVIRNFSRDDAKQLVKEVLKMDDPVDVQMHIESALEDAGLAGLIRAGIK